MIDPEKYGKGGNDKRFEDLDRAVHLEQATKSAWVGHDDHLIIGGKSDIEGKISGAIGMIRLLLPR